MIDRCMNMNNKSFEYYGGRGIAVCDEWQGNDGFMNFYNWSMKNGYNDDLSIDRIDVNGNYEPGNCRWATWKEQMNNTRSNVYYEHNGEYKTASQWSDYFGIEYNKMRGLLDEKGMDYIVEYALGRWDCEYE